MRLVFRTFGHAGRRPAKSHRQPPAPGQVRPSQARVGHSPQTAHSTASVAAASGCNLREMPDTRDTRRRVATPTAAAHTFYVSRVVSDVFLRQCCHALQNFANCAKFRAFLRFFGPLATCEFCELSIFSGKSCNFLQFIKLSRNILGILFIWNKFCDFLRAPLQNLKLTL